MPQSPLEWAGAIVCGAIGCILGYALNYIFALLLIFAIPLLFHLGLDAVLTKKTEQSEGDSEGYPTWVWQPLVAGLCAGLILHFVQGAAA